MVLPVAMHSNPEEVHVRAIVLVGTKLLRSRVAQPAAKPSRFTTLVCRVSRCAYSHPYDPATGLWTWENGSSAGGDPGSYGTKGIATAGNTPPARHSGMTWVDSSGHLWLFGGFNGYSLAGNLNDLWMYDIGTNEWTWIGGATTTNATGTNGTLGIAAAGNTPGGSTEPGFWKDHSGRFWLFGGSGYGADSSAGGGWLSDLWMFDPDTQQWTWVNGPSDPSNNAAVYGTHGTPAPNNVPGGRVLPVGWVDSNGGFWMFGGYGADSNGYHFDLNDLWKF
jgi:Galactose oxidase, central domain